MNVSHDASDCLIPGNIGVARIQFEVGIVAFTYNFEYVDIKILKCAQDS